MLRLIVVARRPSTPSSPRKCRSQAVAARVPGVRQNDIRAPGRRPPRRRPCNDAVLRQHLNDPSGQCHSDGHLCVPTRPAHRHPARLSPDQAPPRDPHLRPRALTHDRVKSDTPTRGPRRRHRDRSAEPAGHPRSPRSRSRRQTPGRDKAITPRTSKTASDAEPVENRVTPRFTTRAGRRGTPRARRTTTARGATAPSGHQTARPTPQPISVRNSTDLGAEYDRSRRRMKGSEGAGGARRAARPTSTEVRHVNVPFSHPSDLYPQKDGRKVR